MTLPPRVGSWRWNGAQTTYRGYRIHHTRRRGGSGPLVLLLHGFPSSSYDWRRLLELRPDQRALGFDFLGFGLSDKPRGHDYSLVWQADLAEDLVARQAPEYPVFLLAHDMGTSVATELMARDIEGRLGFELTGVMLLNGSMVQGAASPTLGQRLLRGRLGPVFATLSSKRFFRSQFGSVFSPGHPLSEEEAEDQWALLRHSRGHSLGHRLVSYMEEREERADRWHGALTEWRPGRKREQSAGLTIGWGMLDPVATPRVLEAVRALRPQVPVREWADLGHYPQIEDPQRVAVTLDDALKRAP